MIATSLSAPSNVRDWTREQGMTLAHASRITAGLSSPGKMPCHSYGLPAAECNVGSKLQKQEGTVCSDCYALKGSYRMYPEVIPAQYRRLASLANPQWADAMVTLIGWTSRTSRVFRWHDSGDLQSVAHLELIAEVCDRLPWVRFWMPTRERGVVREYKQTVGPLPANLVVRESAALVGYVPRAFPDRFSSGVAVHGTDIGDAHACPAYKQDGECGSCRACWSDTVPVVVYPLH